MYRFMSVVAVSGLLLASAAHAGNPNKKLKGDYSGAATSFCAQAAAGFSETGQALGPVTPLTRTLETIRSYDGEGAVTITGRTFQVATTATAPGNFPVNESAFSCTGTYQVNDDLSFSETVICSGTVISGATAGQTFVQSPTSSSGQIRGKTLLLKDTIATQSSITLSGAGTLFRLCSAAGTAVKVDK